LKCKYCQVWQQCDPRLISTLKEGDKNLSHRYCRTKNTRMLAEDDACKDIQVAKYFQCNEKDCSGYLFIQTESPQEETCTQPLFMCPRRRRNFRVAKRQKFIAGTRIHKTNLIRKGEINNEHLNPHYQNNTRGCPSRRHQRPQK